MNPNIYCAVAAILNADEGLSAADRAAILDTCHDPSGRLAQDGRPPSRLLTTTEASKLLNISRTTLWRLVREGVLRQVVLRSVGSARYRLEEIEDVLEGRRRERRVCHLRSARTGASQ